MTWARMCRVGGWMRAGVIGGLVLLVTAIVGCGGGSKGGTDKGSDAADAKGNGSDPADKRAPKTAKEVFERMVAVYRAAKTYSDRAQYQIKVQGAQPYEATVPFEVTFERPNKFTMRVDQFTQICDGQRFYATISDLAGQYVDRKAPKIINAELALLDPVVAQPLVERFACVLPQLVLLTDKDPAKILLGQGTEEPSLADDGTIVDRECYRLRLRRPEGTATFWIDKRSYLLRRLDFPVEEDLRQAAAQRIKIDSISSVVDFINPQVDGELPPKAFAFSPPRGAQPFEYFIRPFPGQLLGQALPAFQLFDLNGKPVDNKLLQGKTAVLAFWLLGDGPSRNHLRNLEEVYGKLKDDQRLAFYSVCICAPEVKEADVQKALADLGSSVPVLRDTTGEAGRALLLVRLPALYVLDAKGVLQDVEAGGNPDLRRALPDKLGKLLAGQDIFAKPRAEYDASVKKYIDELSHIGALLEKGEASVEDERIPVSAAAAAQPPRDLVVRQAWQCPAGAKAGGINTPGYMLVVPPAGPQQKPRILVVDDLRSIVELSADGQVIGRHECNLDPSEVIVLLRTGVGRDGKRWYAALNPSAQRVHVFDDTLKHRFSFPEDALQNPHDGLTDVQFADLDGDGELEMYVGYWGSIGVQRVSLSERRRTAANRRILLPQQLIPIAGQGDQPDLLYVLDQTAAVTGLDRRLERLLPITAPEQRLQFAACCEFEPGRREWCGLMALRMGENVAVGFEPGGRETWNYTLPEGSPPQLFERIVGGRVLPGKSRQWILSGPDGSIHLLSADGRLIDRFNYGQDLHGMAALQLDGRPLLVLSSKKGIEALELTPK